MKKASFALTNYVFKEVSLDLSNKQSEELEITFDPRGLLNFKNRTYNLLFSTLVTSKDTDKAFIKVTCDAEFVFKDLENLADVPDFFYRNAIAILFPYVRAYISLISTQANFKGVILPTLNLMPLEEVLKEKTEVIKE
jgi:preprotein translocase subunit SecB